MAGVLLAGTILLGTYLFQQLQGPPDIAGAYQGQIINTLANKHTPMMLTIQQDQTSIHGFFTVAKPLSGNGPLTGNVDAKGKIMFLVRSKDPDATNPILFTGAIQPDKSLAGSYCSVKLKNQTQCEPTMGHGIWNVTRTTSGLTSTTVFLGYFLIPFMAQCYVSCYEPQSNKFRLWAESELSWQKTQHFVYFFEIQ